ncbi:MAG TPA: 2-iminoacetate synthase ThiH [Actinomycetota bacterium]|nr:2-iminoacetate synthase ThiH [Actinomycetota bacterium]
MSFLEVLEHTPVRELARFAAHADDRDVVRALETPAGSRDLEDFAALISPAAAARLEQLARASHALTLRRFGRTVHMYAPLYLSNECLTTCTYCGFAKGLSIARKTLSVQQALREGGYLRARGYRHVLLLTGEHQKLTGVDFLCEHVAALRALFPQISLEVQVWDEGDYRRLAAAGADGVVIYQETYDPDSYARFHLAGRKRDHGFRLGGPERAARAGIRRLGIGALLGLHEPWREDAIALASHALYLLKAAWRQELAVSIPRIRPSASGYSPEHPVTDAEMAQLVCALRLVLPDAGIVMSTRESAAFRDGLVALGVTYTSAGSHTDPGGYTEPGEAEGQFEIDDTRAPEEVAAALRALGYEPVWKDWDAAMRAEPVA